jgi:hypothetical protein
MVLFELSVTAIDVVPAVMLDITQPKRQNPPPPHPGVGIATPDGDVEDIFATKLPNIKTELPVVVAGIVQVIVGVLLEVEPHTVGVCGIAKL